TASEPPAHLIVALPSDDRVETAGVNLALSADGSRLVYVAVRDGIRQLFIQSLDSTEAKPIPGTEGGFNPFFSPDGRRVGFFANQKMKWVSLGGGVPQAICDAGISGGATWGSDETIVFAPAGSDGLWQVSLAGGKPSRLTTPDSSKGEL